MPTIYEYFGIILKFFSKEHLPIHVHAYYGENYAMKIEFYFKGEKIVRKVYKELKGFQKFPPSQMRDLKALINKYEYQICKDFINFVIKNQRVSKTTITRRIK